ncbi:MAG TPA: S46 family peptidase [Chitinophagaceae bacterium]|nr:S46 family peptidase [Chitinophagaceae bacterium]
MKKILLSVILLVGIVWKSLADEGMWLPLLLGQQVYNDMVKRGLKLSKEQLYSINKSSIKDAVILFGSGCTGAVVSNEGLLFTNHHCGYDAVASASSVEHNYLRDGFYAKTKQEEIPSTLSVQFLLSIEDVTKEIDSALGNLGGAERSKQQAELIAAINSRYSDLSQGREARVSTLFKGNQFLVFVYQRYSDVRLVGVPTESIGKFGGDTDNWEWPRHTGDFSVFRIYMSKDGKPAPYAPDNIPYKPKYALPVSLKGYKDGDYAMIYGYPGSTNRYETSYGVKQKIEITNPSLVALRDMRLKYMLAEMKKDPAIKLQLAANYASIANYWKFYDGETKQLVKYKIYDQKKTAEAGFQQWANDKPAFQHLLADWEKAYATWRPYSKQGVYINEGILGSPLLAFAATLQQVEYALVQQGGGPAKIKSALEAADKARTSFLSKENKASDQNIVAAVLLKFYTDIDKNQHPISFYSGIKGSFGDLLDESTYRKYASQVFKTTMIFNDAKWQAFLASPDATVLQEDPAYSLANSFMKNWQGKFLQQFQVFTATNNELGRLYLKGIMQMDTVKAKKMYPDATLTMRVSYGNVKSYSPTDAARYDYVCTIKGALQKYVPGDYEFDLPANLIEKAKNKDFGQYTDKIKNDLVVCFITTNDITGGNSGSPVIDANGNLIGLAFDGNYEALSHKIAYDKNFNRTICVDVRYILWCIDKLGGASNIINELKLVKQ